MPNGGVHPLDVLKNLLLSDRRARWLDGSYWTLPLEMRWYLVFPFVLWLWVYSRKAVVALCALVWLLTYETRAFYVDGLVLPLFFMGIIAADLYVQRDRRLVWGLPIAAVGFVLATALGKHGGWTNPLWEVSIFALVAGTAACAPVTRFLNLRSLAAVSGASYGIYLVHEPVVAFVEAHATGLPIWAAMVTAGVTGIMVGWAFSYVFERPFVRGAVCNALRGRLEGWFAAVLHFCGMPAQIALPKPSLSPPKEAAPLTSSAVELSA